MISSKMRSQGPTSDGKAKVSQQNDLNNDDFLKSQLCTPISFLDPQFSQISITHQNK